MPNYSFVLDTSNERVVQFNHDAGTFVRDLGQFNSGFSPFFNTNFDPVTGLPLAFALGPTDFVNPCSVTSDAASCYVLDPMTCRVLRFDAAGGSVIQTFGGKRGIGAGRITPDSSHRSVIAYANSTVWVADNAGGFVSQFSPTGVFQNDYSIATWASNSGLTNIDQVTGIAWDVTRGHYWVLTQDSGNCYLLRVSAAGVAQSTGNFNLTTRLGIPGHSGTASGRLLTRGLKFFGGYLYLWSQTKLYRVDILNPDGDLTVYTDAYGTVAPGWVDAAGATAITVSTAAPNNASVIELLSLPSGSILRAYAPAAVPASSATDHVSLPWDATVAPYSEDTNTRISNDGISAKARILGTSLQSVKAKANISNRTAQTVQAKARITNGTQQQTQAMARVDLPAGDGDGYIYEWSIDDSFGNFSRAFSVSYRKANNLQAGNQVDLWAGYDYNRMHLMQGLVDSATKVSDPNSTNYTAGGRDLGAREIESMRFTGFFQARPPNSLPLASDIIQKVCAFVGVEVGAMEFPDYYLWNSLSIIGKNVLEVATELLAPWNIFARVQYVPVIRNRVFSIIKVDWQNPPAGGVQIRLGHESQVSLWQQTYLDSPRLNEAQNIVIRGAAYRALATNLGIQTRVEYYRTTSGQDVLTTFLGEISKPGDVPGATKEGVEPPMVITETVAIETFFCDKLLTRDEKVYTNSHVNVAGVVQTTVGGLLLTSWTREQNYYIDPFINQFGQIVQGTVNSVNNSTVNGPGQSSLLWVVDSTHSGIVDVTSGGVTSHFFQEDQRTKTEYFYDINQQVSQEVQRTDKFNTDTNQWEVSGLTSRSHSQITGSSIRTQLQTFVFDNSVFKTSLLDHQITSGARPDPNQPSARGCLVSHQAQSPQGQVDPAGHVIDNASFYYTWQYENPLIGQTETDQIYQNALTEKTFQLAGYKWETVNVESILNPNLYHGQPASIEVEPGNFVSYWIQNVVHRFETQKATTAITARRLTLDVLT